MFRFREAKTELLIDRSDLTVMRLAFDQNHGQRAERKAGKGDLRDADVRRFLLPDRCEHLRQTASLIEVHVLRELTERQFSGCFPQVLNLSALTALLNRRVDTGCLGCLRFIDLSPFCPSTKLIYRRYCTSVSRESGEI